jgi:2-hydroxy-6-oxonona-2,4-dienedioate hydrolase
MTSSTATARTEESTSHFAQTDRYRIHYHDVGTGHPIVLLHGSGPGATGWSNFWPNIGHLATHHRVIAVDMPGWGKSDTPNSAVGWDPVLDLVGLLDLLEIDKAALVGNSMGGMTSLGTAVRFPERVSHVVTMGAPSPGANIFSPSGVSEGMKVLLNATSEPSPENLKRLVQIMCYDQSMATDELAEMRYKAAVANRDHLASFFAMFTNPQVPPFSEFFQLGPRVAEITAPTLAIHGRDDRVLSYEHSLRLVATVANSRLVLLNRCGHWAQIEHADEFNRIVADFVDNSTPAPR